jgi:hypothetical protein
MVDGRMVTWARHVAAAMLGRGNGCSTTPLCSRWDEVGGVALLGKRAEAQEWCIGVMGELNLSESNSSESNLKACGEDDMVR